MTDSARREILARRTRFVAMALAGVGVAGGCRSKPTAVADDAQSGEVASVAPAACLKPMAVDEPRDGGAFATPCLQPMTPPDAPALPRHDIFLGAATVKGAAIPNVDAVVSRHRWRFKACHARALGSDPSVEGSATFEVNVDRDGNVTTATPTTTGLSSGLAACTSKAFLAMLFDAPGAATSFSLKVTFSLVKP